MTELFQIAVLRIGVSLLAALVVVSALVGLRQVGRLLLRNLKPVALAALLPLVVLLTDFAGEKNTNMPLRIIQPVASQTFSSCGAVTNSYWLARGAYEDWFCIPATNWWARMPGGGWIDRLRIFSFGGFQAKDTSGGAWTNYPPPFPQKFSMAPMANWHMLTNREALATSHESLFWHGVTESNTLVMTWQDGLYARCATNLVSFQAELFNNGSVAYRYDGSPVATNDFIVPLELPFDRDGDGLENSVDPEPDVAGLDAHGTSAEWYNVVCSNVFSAVECGGTGTTGILPIGDGGDLFWREGVNSNAYYFVDVVSERGPSPIRFTGDRTCRLGDPAVVALAGETNRVPILIGISYAVTSDTPFTVSFPVDYPYVEVETNEPCVARIRWPLDFEFTESTGPSNRTYAVTVVPYDPGGEFSWGDGGGVPMRGGTSGGGCSCVSYDGHGVVFGCTEQCQCAGTCLAVGTYSLENASFPFAGGECRCGFDDPEEPEGPPSSHDPNDGPSFTISFSKSAVIFEDAYEDRPGYLKPKRSSRVRLTVDAYGGTHGGTVDLTSVNLHKLSPLAGGQINLPASFGLDAHGTFYATCVYEGTEASTSAGDVSVSGVFTEADTGLYVSSSNSITVVKVELRTHVTAPGNASRSRHAYGVCEKVALLTSPLEVNVEWNCNRGVSAFVVAPGDGTKSYVCPTTNDVPDNLHLLYGGAEYVPLISIVEPSGFHIRGVTYMDMNCPSGIVGGLEMRLPMFVLPTSVSFSNVYIQEVPCYDEIPPVGYFTNAVNKSHTLAAGAGNWGQPALSGYWMTDKVGRLPVTNGWSAGTMVWKIPIGWNAAPASPVAKEINPDQYRQRFEIFSNGTLRIDKHENWISRTIDDHIFLNGEQMK